MLEPCDTPVVMASIDPFECLLDSVCKVIPEPHVAVIITLVDVQLCGLSRQLSVDWNNASLFPNDRHDPVLNRRGIIQLGKAVMRLAGRIISVTLSMVENNWLDRLQ